ncbi:hypothetical protein C173_12827 [Paenibacillus sp. FSL R7-277]|nr:hypothetical protein C173_12827 [Paenibacillus sp. FSL R7-277]
MTQLFLLVRFSHELASIALYTLDSFKTSRKIASAALCTVEFCAGGLLEYICRNLVYEIQQNELLDPFNHNLLQKIQSQRPQSSTQADLLKMIHPEQ